MMGFELDGLAEPDRELVDGLTRAFTECFADIPQGNVIGIDEFGADFVRLHMREPDQSESTWLITFRVGEEVEATRIG